MDALAATERLAQLRRLAELRQAAIRSKWLAVARPEQVTPEGGWLLWFLLGGRGSGKTRAGAEDIGEYLRTHAGVRVALVAPTFADARDTMCEGESGLLSTIPDAELRGGSRATGWNRSVGEVWMANGSRARCHSSERPDRLRGPQHHRAWVEEPGAWHDAAKGDALDTTWTNLMLGLRLGDHPQVVATGTPKPLALIRHLLATADVVSRMSSLDNLDNLAPTFRAQVLERYEGTRLWRQEVMGELLEDIEGALWTNLLIDPFRMDEAPDLARVVVGVDPSASSGPGSAETGIVVAGVGSDGRYYVVGDYSLKASPEGWASAVGRASDLHEANLIVPERNNGGEMVATVLRQVRSDLRVKPVWASKGKTTRAEPVVALYEQGRVSHVGNLGLLESQMTTWVPGDPSPDRVDALVWAMTELMGRGVRAPLRLSTRG